MSPDESGTQPTVVIADDETDITNLYASILANEYDVRTAYNGEEALEAVDETVDLALLDLKMPERSGEQALTELRNRGYDFPIGFVSGYELEERLLTLEFDDYIVKPLSADDLREFTDSLLARRDLGPELREYFALISKLVLFRQTNESANIDDNETYQQLSAQLNEVQDTVEGRLTSIAPEEYHVWLREEIADKITDTPHSLAIDY
ncbi:MAG: response regulator [Halobacteriaceae archaeon]